MPRDLKQALLDTAATPTRPVDARGIVRRARRQRLVQRILTSSAVAFAVIAVVAGAAAIIVPVDRGIVFDRPSPPSSTAPARWADTATFASPTHAALLFDTGSDRVLAVDLDAAEFTRLRLEGLRSGDAPYRLWRTGDALVVGWGRVYAVPIATGSPRLLGEATIFVPATEPGHVWLVGHEGTAGPGQQGLAPSYRLVDIAGETREEAPGLPDLSPAHGVTGGMALESDTGVAIWDSGAHGVVARLGDGVGFVADARDRTLVWCEGDCAQLHVTDLDGGSRPLTPPVGSGEVFGARSARLSPDGSLVATIVHDAGPLDTDSAGVVVVLDVQTGRPTAVTDPLLPPPSHLAWTQDGSQLFFTASSQGASETNLGRYTPVNDTVELAVLPIGGALSFVALGDGEAQAFLEGATPLPGASPTQEVQETVVPDVQWLSLAEAHALLGAAGLTGDPASGPGWSDPPEPQAVVVSQKPSPGTRVARGEIVGMRTALVSQDLCRVFSQVPGREGDARALARAEGYWDMISEARPLADPPLAGHINELLAHRARGGGATEAPTRALDSVAIHHDACAQEG